MKTRVRADHTRVAIIGGGLFGCTAAYELANAGCDVILFERNAKLLQEASLNNHNRLHFGYHYPRSLNTARQSVSGMLSFMIDFHDAIIVGVPNYYAIAKHDSRVTTDEFIRFCHDAHLYVRDVAIPTQYFTRDEIDSCFLVREPIFNFSKIYDIVTEKLLLHRDSVSVMTCAIVVGITQLTSGEFDVTYYNASSMRCCRCDYVINVSYSGYNEICAMLDEPGLTLLYEDVEIPIIKCHRHDGFDPRVGLTVMDGSFCTIMPKGNSRSNEMLLYHVDASVHSVYREAFKARQSLNIDDAAFRQKIINASAKYMPFLGRAYIVGAYRTVRVVRENDDDARLTETHVSDSHPGFISVLSGKISTASQTAINLCNVIAGNSNHKTDNEVLC